MQEIDYVKFCFNCQDAEQSSKFCYAHSPLVVSVDLGIMSLFYGYAHCMFCHIMVAFSILSGGWMVLQRICFP